MAFASSTSIEIPADLHAKVKKHCATHGIKLSQFVEEAIIEKMIQPQIR
jgi:metallophosphoesterase superfamily enzyme